MEDFVNVLISLFIIQFCQLFEGYISGLLFVNILLMIIGIIGNLLVIGIVFMNVSLQIIFNYWLVSMVVVDLMVIVFS